MTTCRLVMPGEHLRGINLANAVSIAAYEYYRQLESLYHLCNKRHEFSEASPILHGQKSFITAERINCKAETIAYRCHT